LGDKEAIRLKEMIARSTPEQFLQDLLKGLLHRFIAELRIDQPDVSINMSIQTLLGIQVSVYEYLAVSTRPIGYSYKDIGKYYKQYLKYMDKEMPASTPLPINEFEQIITAPDGIEAFRLWLEHHYADFASD
jgi:hypothetical protein